MKNMHAVRRFLLVAVAALSAATMLAQKATKDEVMTREKGNYVVNTTTLCQTQGYRGTTPLIVTLTKKGTIESVEALANQETPRFFARVKEQLIAKYKGMKIADVDKVDAVSGATLSSNAVKAHVSAACAYYKKHK